MHINTCNTVHPYEYPDVRIIIMTVLININGAVGYVAQLRHIICHTNRPAVVELNQWTAYHRVVGSDPANSEMHSSLIIHAPN